MPKSKLERPIQISISREVGYIRGVEFLADRGYISGLGNDAGETK